MKVRYWNDNAIASFGQWQDAIAPCLICGELSADVASDDVEGCAFNGFACPSFQNIAVEECFLLFGGFLSWW